MSKMSTVTKRKRKRTANSYRTSRRQPLNQKSDATKTNIITATKFYVVRVRDLFLEVDTDSQCRVFEVCVPIDDPVISLFHRHNIHNVVLPCFHKWKCLPSALSINPDHLYFVRRLWSTQQFRVYQGLAGLVERFVTMEITEASTRCRMTNLVGAGPVEFIDTFSFEHTWQSKFCPSDHDGTYSCKDRLRCYANPGPTCQDEIHALVVAASPELLEALTNDLQQLKAFPEEIPKEALAPPISPGDVVGAPWTDMSWYAGTIQAIENTTHSVTVEFKEFPGEFVKVAVDVLIFDNNGGSVAEEEILAKISKAPPYNGSFMTLDNSKEDEESGGKNVETDLPTRSASHIVFA